MLARTKQTPPLTLTERIRAAAVRVRELSDETNAIVELYIDEQKATQDGAGLPRGSIKLMLMGKYSDPWRAMIGLEKEREHE